MRRKDAPAIRYLIRKPRKGGGHLYYWQPPSKYASRPDKPAWLRNTTLRDDQGRPLSEHKAIARAEELTARLEHWRGNAREPDGQFSAVIRAFKESPAFAELAPKTRREYGKHLDALEAVMGHVPPEGFSRQGVTIYIDGLKKRTPASVRQIQYRLAVLRLLWSWAARRGLVPTENPASRPDLRQPKARAAQVWTLALMRRLVAEAPPSCALALRLALYTVQRQGDILDMRWIDLADGFLRVTQNKTGAAVVLPVHPSLLRDLEAGRRPEGFILSTRHGRAYGGDGFRTVWRKAVAALGVPCPTFHDLRGTAISMLKAGGLGDEDVMLWTGHGREGGARILDAYDARLGDMAARAFPIMDRWGV